MESQIEALSMRYEEVLKQGLADGLSVADATAKASEAVQWGDSIKEITLGGVESAIKVSGVSFDTSFIRRRWLNQTFDGVKLSDTIVKSGAEGSVAVSKAIQTTMQAGKSWTTLANRIGDTGLIKADASQQIMRLADTARRAYGGTDPQAVIKYKSELSKAVKQIERLKESASPTGNLKRAYQRVIDATESGSKDAIDKAISKAVEAKMKSNAQRIARTEMADAWGKAKRNEYMDDPDVVAMRYTLSSSHTIYDICNLNTSADLYGWGEGVYPLDKGPEYPFHANCMCTSEPIFSDEVKGNGKFNPKGGDDYLESIPESKAQAILGKSGLEEWQAGDAKWQDVAKNYSGQLKQVYTPMKPK